MRFNDALTGLVLILFAAAMFWITLGFPAFPGQKYGPSLFPRILASGIAIGGAVLVARGLAARRSEAGFVHLAAWTREIGPLGNFVGVLAALFFYIFASDALGFIPTAFLILTVLILRLGTRLAVAVPVALGTTVAMQWFFGSLMRIPLPRGLFEIIF